MRVTVTECTMEAVVEQPVAAPEPAPGWQGRSSAATEADKVRRQQHLRRKTRLARRALTANRTR